MPKNVCNISCNDWSAEIVLIPADESPCECQHALKIVGPLVFEGSKFAIFAEIGIVYK